MRQCTPRHASSRQVDSSQQQSPCEVTESVCRFANRSTNRPRFAGAFRFGGTVAIEQTKIFPEIFVGALQVLCGRTVGTVWEQPVFPARRPRQIFLGRPRKSDRFRLSQPVVNSRNKTNTMKRIAKHNSKTAAPTLADPCPVSGFATKAEAAKFLRTSIRTVDRLIECGKLKSKKIIRSRRIPWSALHRLAGDRVATA